MYYGVKQNSFLSKSKHKQINIVRGRFGKHKLVKNSQTDKKTRQPDRQTDRQTKRTDEHNT